MSEQLTNAHEYSVSEISTAVKQLVEEEFAYVRVRGEVSRMSRPGSGHIYFDLKDDRSVIAAVAWKGTSQRWRFQPEQGLEVIVTGRLTTFPGQSKYQIVVESVEPAGLGALMALLEERRKKLLAEGLFDEDRKQALPYLPQVIGVVTSPSGAVIRDILHRLHDRFPRHVIVWPVRVQGEGCAEEVAAAINGFNALGPDGPIARPDLLIVARGGGSVEDLWGFNEEVVVRAVAASTIPVISAIGHETDVTLVDYVADRRAPTPTGAAEIAVPVRADLIASIDESGLRLRGAIRRAVLSLKDRLRAARAGLPRPAQIAETARQRLDFAGERLRQGLSSARQHKGMAFAEIAPRLSPQSLLRSLVPGRQLLQSLDGRRRIALLNRLQGARAVLRPPSLRVAPLARRHYDEKLRQFAAFAKLLESVGPRSVLARGFALVTDPEGKVINEAQALAKGEAVVLEFADGKAGALITEPVGPATKFGGKDKSGGGGQSSLF